MSGTNDNRLIYKNSYIRQYRYIVRLTQDEYKWFHEEEGGIKEDGKRGVNLSLLTVSALHL